VSVEVHGYRLEVRGVPAGRQVVRSKEEGGHVRMETEATFEGPLPAATVVQLSRSLRDGYLSREFRETIKDRSGERRFQVVFDGRDGLVKLQQGDDKAEAPYVEAFRDPLSMLRELRHAPPDADRVRVPMLGKTVEARPAGETELDTPLGRRRARAFQLFPGGSWVWVDLDAPHAIVKFRQRTPDGAIDGLLERVAEETALPVWDAQGKRSSGRRRGKRRKRRRGGRSRSSSSGSSKT
jgi:hypothetical protein